MPSIYRAFLLLNEQHVKDCNGPRAVKLLFPSLQQK